MTAQKKLEVLQNTLWDVIQSQDGRAPEYERNQVESLKAAIFALEKQIPETPILDIIYPSGIKSYKCPVCGKGCLVSTNSYCPKYCLNCGQALDWSGDCE